MTGKWVITNFIADEELEQARRLLSHGADDDGDDESEARTRTAIIRNIAQGHANLVHDYIGLEATCTDATFERRFLLSQDLFLKLENVFASRGLMNQGVDAVGRKGPTREQKMLCALRVLQTGAATDAMDDYFRMGDSTSRGTLKKFCAHIDEVFGNHFLRWPAVDDLKRLCKINAARGFPGMIGSLDCTHWAWRACRRARAGAHKGKEKKPTIVIEALCDQETRFWHLFVGTPGSCNDLNVLDRSPLMNHFMNSTDPVNQVQFSINNQKRTTGYMLGDGIYPEYAIFATPLSESKDTKHEEYNKRQAAVRKDVERAFGGIKGRYGILDRPARFHDIDDLITVYRACIILHNIRIDHQNDHLCLDKMTTHKTRWRTEPSDRDYDKFKRRYVEGVAPQTQERFD